MICDRIINSHKGKSIVRVKKVTTSFGSVTNKIKTATTFPNAKGENIEVKVVELAQR